MSGLEASQLACGQVVIQDFSPAVLHAFYMRGEFFAPQRAPALGDARPFVLFRRRAGW
jgi:hypothetical protein